MTLGKVVTLSKGGVRGRNSGVAAAQPPGCVDATVALHACNPVSSYTKSYLLSHSHVSPNSTSMWTPGVDCPLGTLDSFVVDDIPEREVRTAVLRRRQQRRSKRFLKGPVPLDVVATAGALPGRALLVLLAIWHRVDLTGRLRVALTAGVMQEFGFDKFVKRRALMELEGAGLIRVQRVKGRATTVELISRCTPGKEHPDRG